MVYIFTLGDSSGPHIKEVGIWHWGEYVYIYWGGGGEDLGRELETLIINVEPVNRYISTTLAPKLSSETMYYYG